MSDLIICAQLNEGMQRQPNPNVPFSAAEIAAVAAACRDAGAAMVHVHPRTPDGGLDTTEEGMRQMLGAIAKATDVLVAPPTLPSTDPSTLGDVVVVEMGSTNMDLVDPDTGEFVTTDRVFSTPTATQLHIIARAHEADKPILTTTFGAAWSRAIGTHRDAGRLGPRVLALLVHGGDAFVAAHPCTSQGLAAHRALLPEGIDWMVSAHRGDVLTLADEVVAAGGHLAVGVGDWPHVERGLPTTAQLVAEVVAIGRRHGREPATPDAVRAAYAPREDGR